MIIVRGSRWVILVIYHCGGPFLRCWAGLPSAVLGPSVLDKGVGTNPIVTHLGPACAQIMPRLPKFWSHTHGRGSYYGRVRASICNNDKRKHFCH